MVSLATMWDANQVVPLKLIVDMAARGFCYGHPQRQTTQPMVYPHLPRCVRAIYQILQSVNVLCVLSPRAHTRPGTSVKRTWCPNQFSNAQDVLFLEPTQAGGKIRYSHPVLHFRFLHLSLTESNGNAPSQQSCRVRIQEREHAAITLATSNT